MASSESPSALVMQLAEEFLERYRRGERPALKGYIDRNPELADEIRSVFSAMAMMENIAIRDNSPAPAETDTTCGGQPKLSHLPEQLGDYRIIREIGHGGMGVVYEAEQVSLGRHVALKVLSAHLVRDHKQQQRFEREARAAAKLHHTNIVPVFGVGKHDGTAYYVMQYIQGQGLDAVVDELERLRLAGSTGEPVGRAFPPGLRAGDVSVADVARSLLTGRFQNGEAKCSQTEANGHACEVRRFSLGESIAATAAGDPTTAANASREHGRAEPEDPLQADRAAGFVKLLTVVDFAAGHEPGGPLAAVASGDLLAERGPDRFPGG